MSQFSTILLSPSLHTIPDFPQFVSMQDSRPLGNALERYRRERKVQNNQNEPARGRVEGARIYVGNLSYTVQMEDVRRLFEERGFVV